MLNEHEIHSRDQSLTIDNYFSTLNDVCKILNDLSNKVSELFVFLKNPNSNGSNSHSSAHLSVDWIIEKSDDISNVFTRVNSAILELEEIKAHVDSLRKENEVVFVENNSLRMKIDENKQCIKSLELELDELNKKYNDENVQRIELEEKYQVLSKEKDKIEDEIQQLETKCQKLLSDKVSLEKKVAEHNELYSNQMETILSQVNCWRNSQVFRLNDVEHTPTNNVNLIENPQNCDFLHVATSTPYPFNMYDLLGADENNKDTFQGDYYSHIALLKWMEKCQLLEQENSQLFIEVESLKSQVSELENSTHVAKMNYLF
uniref:Putative golgin subfamily protein n=1 Tax=Rhodnius prolixus TaxID=13249 RepID=A0A4P6DI07_RHOPR